MASRYRQQKHWQHLQILWEHALIILWESGKQLQIADPIAAPSYFGDLEQTFLRELEEVFSGAKEPQAAMDEAQAQIESAIQ